MTNYEKILTEKIIILIQNGVVVFHEILQNCEGADPRKVNEIINSLDLNDLKKEYPRNSSQL